MFASMPLALVIAACAQAPVMHASKPPVMPIRLIAFNDFHGNIDPPGGGTNLPDADGNAPIGVLPTGGVAYLATAVDMLKRGHAANAVVAAGDLIGASPLNSALFHDEPTIELLGQIGLEVSSVGNHEFDKGAAELRRLQQGGCFPGGTRGVDTCVHGDFVGARYRYLSANVVDEATGQTFFAPSAVKTFDIGQQHVQIGFIGLVLRDTPTMVSHDGVSGLRFIDEADAANAQVAALKAQGVQAFVVLIHQGGRTSGVFKDTSEPSSWFDDHRCPDFHGELQPILARLDPAIRVVISGHTHQAYVCDLDGRLVTSAGAYGRLLTAIDLSVDPASGVILEAKADNLPIASGQLKQASQPVKWPVLVPDSQIAARVADYDARVKPIADRVVGRITADLPNDSSIGLDPAGTGESPDGDVVADAMLEATRSAGAQLAFINTGGIRAPLRYAQQSGGEQPGEVTYGEVYNVQPFTNALITMTLSGAQIETLLAQQWVGQKRPMPLAVSHTLHYVWDASRPDGSDKLVQGSVRIEGKPLLATQHYRVTVNSFMAAGGDNARVLLEGTDKVAGITDCEALVAYLQRHSPVSPPAPSRIERRN